MHPEVEQELAHTLLVELLAYQFASPVRWIETQDVILAEKTTERIVEVGPADTLGGMAKRTLAAKYEAYDAARSIQRQILCYNKDAKDIYYDVDPVEDEPEAPATGASDSSAPAAGSSAPTPAAAAIPPPPAGGGVAPPVEDAPVKAVDILRSLVAQKLKKYLTEIPLGKAVKDLVGGKSTLQNEILGDLGKEFGNTPEKPEDTPLDELGASMQSTFNGQLGKQSSSLIARMVSSKMPGGFNITAVRKHLETRWGLGQGRQDGVLLLAITSEPPARLGSENDAKTFFDEQANKYAEIAGISLSTPTAAGDAGGAGGMMMDPAAIDALTKDQRALFKQQLELFARYLKIDLRAGDKAFAGSQESSKVLQAQLDLWNTEHGDFYAAGIEPSFSPLKARVYDSSWNWARQDALSMYYDIIFGRLKVVDREIVSRCIYIMNRSNPLLLDFMQYHIDHCPTERGETYKLAKQLGEQLIENCKDSLNTAPVYKDVALPTGPQLNVDARGNMNYKEAPRESIRKLEHYVKEMAEGGKISEYGNRTKVENDLQRIYKLIRQQHKLSKTSQLQIKSLYEEAAREGVTFQGKNVLMTGAGAGSIGAEVLQGLISGGAKVIVTTSRFSKEVTEYYQSMYARFGAKGSQLVVVPFNQGSKQDVEALVSYIYDTKNGLGWDLDFIVPFAAIPENGREIDNIDSKSELAHRIMLTNLLRMLGAVKAQKAEHGFETRPAQVVLPLSPNHGTFGNDGLYSESKLALETLFNRWHSESWGNYLTICGAVIGWTRGTGLMGGNNLVAEGVEKYGVRTFSQQEMAFNLLGLMSPTIVNLCQMEPVFADLNGGLQFIPDLKDIMTNLRKEVTETSEIRKAVTKEVSLENKIVHGEDNEALYKKVPIQPRANIKFDFPRLPDWETEVKPLNGNLKDMVDLEKVVVVTGFSEVGPWGNSRTRWEMEAYGQFSIEGCVEMAWIMGLIKNHNGPLKGQSYSGWIDSKTEEPVDDKDVKGKYEKHILDHSGIRLIEPELFGGYDPQKKHLLQEIQIEEDLDPFECSKETADEFKHEHGDNVEVFEIPDSGEYSVRIRKGATLMIPKALRFDRLVAGQIPTGWNAKTYGIEDDIISQVDPVTLYVLVCTVEALLASGITDPYEFYKYVHLSQVGNCIGSGIGGTTALRGMYKDRFMEKPVQKDILQESFINTMSAWVNMLLMSSTGPIKTPVGACATAVESIDIGYDTIVEGKARVCFVGGFDDFQEEGSYEFANMKATSSAESEFNHGRTPKEMSRPTTTTRNGFMESQGCGMQVIMDARLALDMGVPIYGILGFTATATDKIGRSVPAPGQGVLTTARENPGKFPSPLLDISYRKRQMEHRRKAIKSWQESEQMYIGDEIAAMKASGTNFNEAEYLQERAEHIEREARRQEKDALYSLGNNFWKSDPRIAPLRGALATWGLTIDDLDVASFHGTSTVANDKNESDVICQQMKHLGRKKGNALMGIFQKYLTGHPKGAAGAWMFNGCLQVLDSGLVPGNRNADNVDKVMEKFDYIVYPSRSIQTDGIKAFSVTSFGFGQKGAQAIGIHPKYLFATLDKDEFQAYKQKVDSRQKKAYRYYHDSLINNTMFRAKSKAPYEEEEMGKIFLNPDARVSADKKTAKLQYPAIHVRKTAKAEDTKQMVESLAKAGASAHSKIGVDVESIEAIPIDNETFIERNFTSREVAYCRKAPSSKASFAGRWSAKEAVFKSLGVEGKGAGAALKEIEIINDAKTGGPTVQAGIPGLVSAAVVATQLQFSFPSIRIGIMVGIGGGVPSKQHDIRLGDVVVSQPTGTFGGVFQYDSGKTMQEAKFQLTGQLNQPPPVLLNAVAKLRADHILNGHKLELFMAESATKYPMLYRRPEVEDDKLYEADYDHPDDEPTCGLCDSSRILARDLRPHRAPMIHYGLIASGNQVMRHGRTRDEWGKKWNVLCFEMEAAGLMSNFPCLIVRGICDYADSHKHKRWQAYAAVAAAAYMRELLEIIPAYQVTETEHLTKRIEEHTWKKLLTRISDYDKEKAHCRLRKGRLQHTTDWILKHPHLKKWLETPSSPSIWCSGGTEPKTLQATYLFRTIVQQLLDFMMSIEQECPEKVKDKVQYFFNPAGPEPDQEDMIHIFSILYEVVPRAIYVVDGLDEMDLEGASTTLSTFHDLSQTVVEQKIFIACRDEIGMNIRPSFAFRIHVSSLETQEDIRLYIKTQVYRRMQQRILTENLDVLEQVKHRLSEEARGMFLWVKLQIEALWLDCFCDEDILSALASLPSDLTATYGRCVARIPAATHDIAIKTLRWLAYAYRPLRVPELQEAVSFSLSDTEWDSQKIISPDLIISCCANLVMVDQSDYTIRLTHPSVKQYLSGADSLAFMEFHIDQVDAEVKCGEECVNYLSFSNFRLELQEQSSKTARFPAPPPMKVLSGLPLPDFTSKISRFFQRESISSPSRIYINAPGPQTRSVEETKYKFLNYARENWTTHTKSISQASDTWARFRLLATQPSNSWKIQPWVSSGQSHSSHMHGLLIWASAEGHVPLLKVLFGETARHDIQKFCNIPSAQEGIPALHLASRLGFEDVVSLLLKVCDSNSADKHGQTALYYCAGKNHLKVAEKLLSVRRVRPSLVSKSHEAALKIAADLGYGEMVNLIITRDETVLADRQVVSNLIVEAAENGHVAILDTLLQKTVQSNLKRIVIRKTLWAAARAGHDAAVELLLKRSDVDVNSRDEHGWTPLHSSAFEGHEGVVKLLLQRSDVDVNSREKDGWTPLHHSIDKGHKGVVKLLLKRGDVDVNSRDEEGWTPLHSSALGGHEGVVKLLLQRSDVDVNSREKDGWTPLHSSALGGHEGVVQLLLQRSDVDVNSREKGGWTPLHYSALGGHEGVVKLLLQHGDIDVCSKNNAGKTPLYFAVKNGHKLTEELLRQNLRLQPPPTA
ncbi:hypothetical protein FH972_022150 [Carpinus fangiana]|uniref:Beta-ketoacyl-[acyl-carrier-protein] synthase I n=1 Tax=Carpinus fangiana TaxID=176857 RepID=A0A5N6KRE0_9ROSI|nr:hypothetical protein FH972_022150 [Carpinus fangiana]